MGKIKVLIKGPLLVQAGYGYHSREIFKALSEDPAFDVYCENIVWGKCSFVVENTPFIQSIKQAIQKFHIIKQQGQENWDIFIHVSIPNEYEKRGKINIGVTAGIETDRVSHVWVQKCQEMDLIIVPSEHAKNVLLKTEVGWENQKTGEKGSFKLTRPVMVCPEGVDTSIYKKLLPEEIEPKILDLLKDAPEFNFLCCGQWGPGGFGQDRKNIALTVKYFIDTFLGQKDVGLVLKINMARNSMVDYSTVLARLQQIKANYKQEDVPPIFLVHGGLTEKEMSSLYNHPKVKALLTLTHGEGFGRHLLEAAACELPVLATNWSGHLDFLNKGKFSAIEYNIVQVPDPVVWPDVIIKESGWAEVREEDTKRRLKKMVNSYYLPRQWAKDLAVKIQDEYDLSVVCEEFKNIIKMCVKEEKVAPRIDPLEALKNLVDTPEDYNVLYTMPMSAGDVFISSAVVDGLVKELPEGSKIYFATHDKYKSILEGNPHIHKVIPWNEAMLNIDLTEEVFDVVFTPNVGTQLMTANWVHKGQGRLLAEEFADHCNSKLGDYFIKEDDTMTPSHLADFTEIQYMTIHVSSQQGQHESRKYTDWQEIVNNLKEYVSNLKIVQIGEANEPLLQNIDVDLRGKTTVHQLASVIKNSTLHLGIDSFPVHLCAKFNTPVVALYGNSYAKSTGGYYKDLKTAKFIYMEPDNKAGCKCRYKWQCKVNRDFPCINLIDPLDVFKNCVKMLRNK